jgi:hypothetical protein
MYTAAGYKALPFIYEMTANRGNKCRTTPIVTDLTASAADRDDELSSVLPNDATLTEEVN